ncbi:MAG: hypothetical protein ACR2H2_04275 [Solirubrobacteraceae bacterium]
MVSLRKERIARNESAFRALNESLEASVHRGRPGVELAGFVCECGDPQCEAIVRLDLATYQSVRQDAQLFVLVPGHQLLEAEVVDDDGGGGCGYVVVRKHEDVAGIVEQTNPRRETG